MQRTLRLNYSPRPRKNHRKKDRPLKRLIIFLAVLIGIAIAIAAHSKKEPARFVAMA
jgi:hypothetical protein